MKAALRPCPTAWAMSSAPSTTSPAAKTYGTLVCSVPGSVRIVPFPAVGSPEASAVAPGDSPAATMTVSQAMTKLAPRDRLRAPAAGGVGRAERGPDAAQAGHPCGLIPHDLERRDLEGELGSLLLGGVDLLGVCRHLVAATPVGDDHAP